MSAKDFNCRYCGQPVDCYKPYHSDEEGFWHFGPCPKKPSIPNYVTITIPVDPETVALWDAEQEGQDMGRIFRHAEQAYDHLQKILPGPMASGLWVGSGYRAMFRALTWRNLPVPWTALDGVRS